MDRKGFFLGDSDSECSACLSGLLTYIVPPLHSFTFNQPPPARASDPLAPGRRADPRRRCAPRCSLRVPPTPPPHSTSRRRQPVSPTSPGPPSGTPAAAARGSSSGYPALGTTYVAAAATPVAALIPQPSRHQTLPPDTLPGMSTPRCQPSSPPP
jgi:hypothetical protein